MTKTISPFSNWHFQTLMQGIRTYHTAVYNKRLKQGAKGKAFFVQFSLSLYSKWKKTQLQESRQGWQQTFGHGPWSQALLAQSTTREHSQTGSWGGLAAEEESGQHLHTVWTSSVFTCWASALSYHPQSPQDLVSQGSFRHKVQPHCMGPDLEATKQAKKGSTVYWENHCPHGSDQGQRKDNGLGICWFFFLLLISWLWSCSY